MRKKVTEDTHQVIQTILPQGFARQNIQLLTRCAFWEDGTIDGDLQIERTMSPQMVMLDKGNPTYMSLENTCIRLAHFRARAAKVHRSRSIACTVVILGTRIAVIGQKLRKGICQ